MQGMEELGIWKISVAGKVKFVDKDVTQRNGSELGKREVI